MANALENKKPIPPLCTTAYTAKFAKKRKTWSVEEGKPRERKRGDSRLREKTRVFLGSAFVRWRELRDTQGLKNDEELALLLLERQDAPSISDVPKYVVDEDCLLPLFEDCPECGSMCDVQKTPRGTFLDVHQQCSKCHFSRNWRSQQTESSPQQENTHNQPTSTPPQLKVEECDDTDESSSQQDNYTQCYNTPLMLKVEDQDKAMPSGDSHSYTSESCTAATITAITGLSEEQNREVGDHSFERNDVINSDDGNQLERHFHFSDENEEYQGNSHSIDKEQEHNSGSGVNNELADEGKTSEVDSGDPDTSGAAAITAIIDFSDENDSSDSESDGGDDNSDSDWKPCGVKLGTDGKCKKKFKKTNSDLEHKPCGTKLGTDEKCEKIYKKPYSCLQKLCPECGGFFRNPKAHTCEYKKPYSCNVCGKRFVLEYKLKVHSKIHNDSYNHVCIYCCSIFRTMTDKLAHEQSHLPAEKPYQCPDCPEVFAKRRERRKHQLIHTGPKEHICHICGMEFSGHASLERHMVVHTKVKQFVCEVCQRSFTQPSHLKSHMRVHTGEKPYQCQHCDKSFNHNVSLKSHIQRYHGQVPDPVETVQMETSRPESGAKKDEQNEMESCAVDAEDTEQSKDTLYNPDGEKEVEKRKYKRKPTGRPKGRPKKNAVITLDEENEKSQEEGDSMDEEREHDSDPISEQSKRKKRRMTGTNPIRKNVDV